MTLLFLLFIIWAINKDWRREDNASRMFDELDKEMEELENMVGEFKREMESEEGEKGKGEEGGVRRRKQKGKKKGGKGL